MKKFLVLAVVAAVLVGCGYKNRPVYNVENGAVPITAQTLPVDRIEALIIQAGASRNWKFQRAGSGHLVATLAEQKLSATVDIYFDQHSYRIIKNSTVGFNDRGSTIHTHYNSWIRTLEGSINGNLAAAGVAAGK